MAGTTRAFLANMVTGVTQGFERKLELVGVGYRAAVQGQKLNLTLGFSHPVEYPIPKGITIETPSQTRDHREGHGPPAGRPSGRRAAPLPAAGALQGQGCPLLKRANCPQRSEEEVVMAIDKKAQRQRRARRGRIRIKLAGRPRLCVHRTPQHIYAQIIAPEGNRVLASASTLHERGPRGAEGHRQQGSRRGRRQGDRGAREAAGHRAGRVRSLGLQVPRSREGARRRGARSGPPVLVRAL